MVLVPTRAATKKPLELKVSSPHVFYQLKQKGKYLRFRLSGEEVGFYLKACHKDYVVAIEDEIKKAFIGLSRFPASSKEGYAEISHRDKVLNLGEAHFKKSAFSQLQMKLFFLMKRGKKECT